MHVAAPAKVNLRLAVLARETSGYHQIETVFCALELADALEIECGGATVELVVEADEDIGSLTDNLVRRAADAFQRATGAEAGVRITLRKRIPAGAGLGGGSSDAAATLRALNELYGRPLPANELLELGAALGSDVPFFVSGAAAAIAWGRGERLLPIPPLPSRPLLLVVPRERIATAEAYAALARRRATGAAAPNPTVPDQPLLADWNAVAAAASNDFEPVIFERLPHLVEIRDALRAAGARPALLSGSGSALFGVFEHDAAVPAATRALERGGHDVRIIETRTATGERLTDR